ncbi:serine hydrolase FSH [Aspergillus granulosus]|uniref:Serine hydrolase FSH n=1 Tax=Aspergillus granulosus TaxID=176169 RepID=A0ABR4GZR9_9EURO
MPKILCLHGHGTSAAIFKAQTASFRAKLDKRYIFDFVDAPLPSAPAAGIDAIYNSPTTYTWYRKPTRAALRAAHGWVIEYARINGPYDAVCCFSQGCSLAATMALYHALEEETSGTGQGIEPLPFRAAIFICGGVPLAALQDLGLDVPPSAHEINQYTGALLNGTAASLKDFASNPELVKVRRRHRSAGGGGLWDGNEGRLLHNASRRPERRDIFGLDFMSFPRWAQIRIPTVHIYGGKDPRWPAGIQLAEFCPERVEYDHGGGHDIPRSTEVSDTIASLIRGVIDRMRKIPDMQKENDSLRLQQPVRLVSTM